MSFIGNGKPGDPTTLIYDAGTGTIDPTTGKPLARIPSAGRQAAPPSPIGFPMTAAAITTGHPATSEECLLPLQQARFIERGQQLEPCLQQYPGLFPLLRATPAGHPAGVLGRQIAPPPRPPSAPTECRRKQARSPARGAPGAMLAPPSSQQRFDFCPLVIPHDDQSTTAFLGYYEVTMQSHF